MLLPGRDKHTRQSELFAPSICLSTPLCMSVSEGKLGGLGALVEEARGRSGAGQTHSSVCIYDLVVYQCSFRTSC